MPGINIFLNKLTRDKNQTHKIVMKKVNKCPVRNFVPQNLPMFTRNVLWKIDSSRPAPGTGTSNLKPIIYYDSCIIKQISNLNGNVIRLWFLKDSIKLFFLNADLNLISIELFCYILLLII
jgi:hypothetical protein